MYLIKRRLRCVPSHAGRRKTTNKKKKPSHSKKPSLLKKILALRSSLLKFSRLITWRINRLAANVRKVATDSDQTQNQVTQLNQQVSVLAAEVNAITGPTQGTRALLQARIGTTATIETNAGSISGTVLAVGIDFVQILEPTGDIVIIPISSITTIA